jgi:hypothetical protein
MINNNFKPISVISCYKRIIKILFIIGGLFLFLTHISFYNISLMSLIESSFFIFILLLIFLYDSINYCRYYAHQRYLIKKKINFSTSTIQIEISKRDLETVPIMKNNRVKIKVKPYKIDCKYILLKNSLILYCQFKFFEIFTFSYLPILIKFNDYLELPFKMKLTFQLHDLEIINNNLIIKNLKNSIGVKRIKIPNITSIIVNDYLSAK